MIRVFSSCRWLIVVCLTLCSACTQLAFFAANTRASFGAYTRDSDVGYGPAVRNTLDIYRPLLADNAHTAVPVVIFVHGGGWNSGDKSYYKFVGAALAAQGYVAVLPNYRLYPQVKAAAMYADVARAVAWVHAHAADWGGDADRVFLAGHSAGAHLAVMLALNARYLEQAGTSTTQLRGVIGLAGPYDFLPFTRPYMADLFGPPDNFAASQPINFVRADAPPLLLMHGLKDTTVGVHNTRNLTAALLAAGGRVQAEYFPEADHGALVASFSTLTRQRAPVLQQISQFIAQPASRQ